MSNINSSIDSLKANSRDRILILDGAMGTMIQNLKLSEKAFRGELLESHPTNVQGNNDLLSLTAPDKIVSIHKAFLKAGSDIITTNTFNATRISQSDYNTEHLAKKINITAARIARKAVSEIETSKRPRFVAGALGPTNKTASISPDVTDPGFRGITFDELRESYLEAAKGLIEGGVDLILLETIFDTLNAKAAIFALEELFEQLGYRLPLIISGTITDLSGRTLTGQTTEAFWNSVRHAQPFGIGLNCSLGAQHMRPYISEFSGFADTLICAYPNAGMPNEFGLYDETPEETAEFLAEWSKAGLVNIVGGCCGTTPEHINAIAKSISGIKPRQVPTLNKTLRLSGLEPLEIRR